ncbi:hypothetical protein KIN20_024253 [Parelaphostrongylus tenuis]|uniref:Uncharacterized protein n=1 Tax=Parelaphostrongylus tenuis TaxID=148309 RepID=A0AAD5N7E4_PARTN|nr:hypothetical protein KIN20_024252 [Parelaphostrongylus tenuis]KAJ1364221.1 hypothetical protein KIN20_024253 [Parelaphostrongylus tenuis]
MFSCDVIVSFTADDVSRSTAARPHCASSLWIHAHCCRMINRRKREYGLSSGNQLVTILYRKILPTEALHSNRPSSNEIRHDDSEAKDPQRDNHCGQPLESPALQKKTFKR